MLDLPTISVHLLPALIPPGALRGGVAIVVDVLRATTAIVHALASGCEAIIPCAEVDEARRVAASLPTGTALLGGERQGLPIGGFDLGNSPGSYTPEVCRGKTLVMTTTNGTRAILASLEAERVLIAAFVNLSATLAAIAGDLRPIHVVCAGTDGLVSFEDTLFAGAIVSKLSRRAGEANDAAILASMAWSDSLTQDDLGMLASGRGGRRVIEIGLGRDLEDASLMDRFDFAAELVHDPLRILRV